MRERRERREGVRERVREIGGGGGGGERGREYIIISKREHIGLSLRDATQPQV